MLGGGHQSLQKIIFPSPNLKPHNSLEQIDFYQEQILLFTLLEPEPEPETNDIIFKCCLFLGRSYCRFVALISTGSLKLTINKGCET